MAGLRLKMAGYVVCLFTAGAFIALNFHHATQSQLVSAVSEFTIGDSNSTSDATVPTEQPVAATTADLSKNGDNFAHKKVFSSMRSLFGFSPDQPPSSQEKISLFKLLCEDGIAYRDRRKVAWRLARFADPETCGILKGYLTDPSQDSGLKAVIAEGLGLSSCHRAKELILYLLENGDVTEVCGAIRGMAARGSSAEIDRLEQILLSQETESYVRYEIISAFGTIQGTKSVDILKNLYKQTVLDGDTVLAAQIIRSLSSQDIARTKEFFDFILSDPSSDPDICASVAEAISATKGEKTPVLLGLLDNPNPDIRAEAAWGLVEMGQSSDTVSAVLQKLKTENDPTVRKHLYQVLAVQDPGSVPLAGQTVDLIYEEPALGIRLFGYLLIANQLQGSAVESLQERFDEQAVRELLQVALNGTTASERIEAVKVLSQAGTTASNDALLTAVATSRDSRVINATGVNLTMLLEDQDH